MDRRELLKSSIMTCGVAVTSRAFGSWLAPNLPADGTTPTEPIVKTSLGGNIAHSTRSRSLEFFALERPAGARLTVMRRSGNVYPVLARAAETRSRPSFTAPCGSPTVTKVGKPLVISVSTSTR